MYKHRQTAWAYWIPLVAVVLGFGVAAYVLDRQGDTGSVTAPYLALPAGVLLLALVSFGSLTVMVDDELVDIRFAAGLIGKRLRLTDVQSCRPVTNRWWCGWGIRWIGRGQWMYSVGFNVSGLDAVELSMKNGKRYRIATDEPQRLCEAIQSRLPKTVPSIV
jgi:hypothetical protein